MTDRQYFEPADLEHALKILDQHPDAGIVAGGTDIVVGHRSGKRSLPQVLLAIHRLNELRGIAITADGGLRIGALVTHAQLEDSREIQESLRALADASALVGSPATRYAGTIGGNVCNASPAMEVGSPLLVGDARVELASVSGTRMVPYRDFVTGPGSTARRPNELLAAVILPSPPTGRRVSSYLRLEYRRAMEIAIVGAAVQLAFSSDGRCKEGRIAITAVAPTCVRVPEAEKILAGRQPDDETINQAAEAAAAAARPIDDVRATSEYRRAMVPVIVRRALQLAVQRAAAVAEAVPA